MSGVRRNHAGVLKLLARESEELVDVAFRGLRPGRVPFSDLAIAATRFGEPVEGHAYPYEPAMLVRIPPSVLDPSPCLVDGIHGRSG